VTIGCRDTVSPQTIRLAVRGRIRALKNRGKSLKVTIDSTEPLADALRVIGALYNVDLAQVPATDDTPPAGPAPGQLARANTAARSRRPRAKTPRADAESKPGRSRSVAGPSSRDIRAWALAHGHVVRDRGSLPAAVRAAYADVHQD